MKKIFAMLLLVALSGCASFHSKPTLLGTMWRPRRIPPYIYLEFTEDGRLVGGIDNDRFFAPIELDDATGELRIDMLAVRRSRTTKPEVEKKFREVLEKVRSYRLTEHELHLRDGNNQDIMVLVSPFKNGKYPKNYDAK